MVPIFSHSFTHHYLSSACYTPDTEKQNSTQFPPSCSYSLITGMRQGQSQWSWNRIPNSAQPSEGGPARALREKPRLVLLIEMCSERRVRSTDHPGTETRHASQGLVSCLMCEAFPDLQVWKKSWEWIESMSLPLRKTAFALFLAREIQSRKLALKTWFNKVCIYKQVNLRACQCL